LKYLEAQAHSSPAQARAFEPGPALHITNPEHDKDTGMWRVAPERDENNGQPVQVIHLNTIFRCIHLLPCYGKEFLPATLEGDGALDAWDEYFVNHFIDYHAHELLA
jgi:hypothetical protein